MKTLKVLFVLCIMLGFAVPANSQGKQVVRPMKGTFYEQTVDKSNPAAVKSVFTANVTHMGNVTGIAIADMRDFSRITNYKTKIAANGDVIYSVIDPNIGLGYITLVVEDPVNMTGRLYGRAITVGGTGRFEGCSGYVDVNGTFNLKTGIKVYTVEGEIKY